MFLPHITNNASMYVIILSWKFNFLREINPSLEFNTTLTSFTILSVKFKFIKYK